MYLTTTPNGMNGYACGAPPGYDGFGGINYSSPVYEFADIIKEAEEYVAQQVALEKAAADKAKAKPRTIICIKGKVQKKVTALNPQCPKGFKKK